MDREEEVRLIAYSLWVRHGCPRDSAVKRWLQAEVIREQYQKTIHNPGPPDGDTHATGKRDENLIKVK
jgi:hypothetical protein